MVMSGNAEHEMDQAPVVPIADDHGHILVVDDDPQIRLLVARFLQRIGHTQASIAGMT